MQRIDGIPVWGDPDEGALQQIKMCAADERVAGVALMGDHHLGYSMPIGGVVAYRGAVSPSGVGYDIGCGNLAVRTDATAEELGPHLDRIMDEVFGRIEFGVGRRNPRPVDHPVLHDPAWEELPELRSLRKLAEEQLGTVGSGNHYVDLLADEQGRVWVGVHFGSRGFGHKTASGFLNLAHGRKFTARAPGESMFQPATVLPLNKPLGQAYWRAMDLAGRYAYAGREVVVGEVLDILGARALESVHNNHNLAWKEKHRGEELVIVRKGSTPAAPGQKGFVGGSMGDISVIVEGTDTPESRAGFHSTIHGAGRVMSRSAARGRWKGGKCLRPGAVSWDMLRDWIRREKVHLRGGGLDESPHCYRRLEAVLKAHEGDTRVLQVLRPLGVAMAGADVFDPYRD